MREILQKGIDIIVKKPFMHRGQLDAEAEKRNKAVKECDMILDKCYFSRKDFERFIDNMIFLIGGRPVGYAIFPVETLDEDGEDISRNT